MLKKNPYTKKVLGLLLLVVALNLIGNQFYNRFDLTQDKRYTLSEAAVETLKAADKPVVVEVLLEGNFPAEFRRLQSETRQILEEFASKNSNVKFDFIEGKQYIESLDDNLASLESNFKAKRTQFENKTLSEEDWIKEVNYYNYFGRMITELKESLMPAQVSVQDGGRFTQELVYPWAIISYEERLVQVPLLKNQLGATSEERITNSIQNLEYAFADGFNKIITPKSKKIAVLSGNGQLQDRHIADFITTLKESYFTAKFTLDSVTDNPQKTLQGIKEYDLIISAQPTEAFTDEEKYVLDQFTMNGGKSLWLVDKVTVEMDSLFSTGSTFAFGSTLNLTDFFFRYGVRINPVLVNDMYAAPLVLATGTESDSQYNTYPWFYSPLSSSTKNHPIVNNIEGVKFDFASPIDLLDNSIKKTVLLATSPITRVVGMPAKISLDTEIMGNLDVVQNKPDMKVFSAGEMPLAVLLEGDFTSVYKNRIKPLETKNHRDEGVETKMIVVSDGNVIKNQFQGNRPLELGFDKWTNTRYGNKDFLLNSVNYLLDENGLINIRSKEIVIPFLDQQKAIHQRGKWQALNLLLPLILLSVFGGLFWWIRKKKYT
ncbi:MAG: gliding motility-associated ABC transporter substrate-binding protein GldG [Flavobacteriaceae bacterium]